LRVSEFAAFDDFRAELLIQQPDSTGLFSASGNTTWITKVVVETVGIHLVSNDVFQPSGFAFMTYEPVTK
jgi:hypothetical protein